MGELEIKPLAADVGPEVLDILAGLRIQVFYDYPYLYQGSIDYERKYLQHYQTPNSLIVGVFDQGRPVGAATAGPLLEHDAAFASALTNAGYAPEQMLYCGESVLLPEYRGRGLGHRFFDFREAHGHRLGLTHSCFAAVIRPDDHPLRPADYRPLDPFWRKRGYQPLAGVTAPLRWRDRGDTHDSAKMMQFWLRKL